MLDAISNPMKGGQGGRPSKERAGAEKLVVFLEEPRHFHVALKLSMRVSFMPFKQALRMRSGFASHWSCSHTEFFTTVRYGYFASERKPVVDKSPLSWTTSGASLDLFAESQEPWTASVYRKRRENAEAARALPPGTDSKKRARLQKAKFTKLDFIALVLDAGLKTPAAVMSHAQAKGSESLHDFVSRHLRKLEEYLEDAANWSRASAVADEERQSD